MSAIQDQTRIGDLFVSKGLVSAEQVAEALRLQSSTGKRLGEVLVDQGLISRMDLASALQVQWKKHSAPPISVTNVAETRSYEESLKAQLAEQEARIAELSQEVEALTAALTDRDERLAVILTFLQAPASR